MAMSWRKAPQDLIETFDRVRPADPRAERRQMFGYPCAFVNGNMFTGLYQESLVVKLPERDREELLKVPGAEPFVPMPGRPMREYVVVPPAMLKDEKTLASWIDRSFAYASTLPVKTPKKKAPKAVKPRARTKT